MVSATLQKEVQIGNGPIELELAIGYGQIGASTIYLGDTHIVLDPHSNRYPLGSGSAIKSMRLTILTAVTDINLHTDKTSVSYVFFENGAKSQEFSNAVSVAENGDMASYKCYVDLK